MKKNRMMRLASVLMVAVMMTTCTISGTFAKYTTSATGSDRARVANWGFESTGELTLSGLFSDNYGDVDGKVVDALTGEKAQIIAPGTKGEATFQFVYDDTNADAPEVDYVFTVEVADICNDLIQANKNIVWSLDDVEQTNWVALVRAIEGLSGDDIDGIMEYSAGQLPPGFANSHKISWEWKFDENGDTAVYDLNGDGVNETTQNQYDTYMGNADDLDDVYLFIEITATQVNTTP